MIRLYKTEYKGKKLPATERYVLRFTKSDVVILSCAFEDFQCVLLIGPQESKDDQDYN